METIREIIARRDGASKADIDDMMLECNEQIAVAVERGSLQDMEDAVRDVFGLEPDFLSDPELTAVPW